MRPKHAMVFLLAGLNGCVARSRAGTAPQTAHVAGTYEVQVCRAPCDPRRPQDVIVRGQLVLEDEAFPLTAISDSARRFLRVRTPYLLVADTADVLVQEDDASVLNACFVMNRAPEARTLAGVIPAGVTKWRRDSTGTIRMTLYESPDARYIARFAVRGSELAGTGASLGAGGRTVLPGDAISGRRVGPPDRALCVRQIEAAAAREHHRLMDFRAGQRDRAAPPSSSNPR